MITKVSLYGLLAVQALGLLSGCTNVETWDRNILAKDNMTIIPDPSGAEFLDHVYIAREGTEGATGVGGGGCGCS